LTRNIVVRGNAASDVDGFGAQMMFLAGSFVQLSGIEVLAFYLLSSVVFYIGLHFEMIVFFAIHTFFLTCR
jgi:hypothetical protein